MARKHTLMKPGAVYALGTVMVLVSAGAMLVFLMATL